MKTERLRSADESQQGDLPVPPRSAQPNEPPSTTAPISHAPTHHDGGGHESVFDPADHQPTSQGLRRVVIGVGLILGLLVVVGVVPRVLRHRTMDKQEAEVADQAVRVLVAPAAKGVGAGNVSLPGSVQPLQETIIYARTNGYVRKYLVDIGDHVKAGQLLAVIDTPEINQELQAAQASATQAAAVVQQGKANLELARTTIKRFNALGPSGVVSQQDLEERQAGFDAQQANLAAAVAAQASAQANVRRLHELESFATVVAPFAGVVTSRTTENGQLVVAGTGNGQPLFKVAEVDVVRVFVNVPQLYAAGVKVGAPAPTRIREHPGELFKGTITRTSNELDPSTRTLLTEIRIPNADGRLFAGMYAEVQLDVARGGAPTLIPATALMSDADGTRVAVVEGGILHWRKVVVDADLGSKVAVSTGINPGDNVVTTPSDRLIDGSKVQAETQK